VGGTRLIKLNIRVIAATNRDLEAAISDGRFRSDLYYRLNVVPLTMPPLRERPEDIPLLASYFAAKYGDRCKRRVTGISDAARACLIKYDWPGNVRELENAIERAVVLGSTERIQPEDLPESVLEAAPSSGKTATTFHDSVKEAKRQFILRAFEEANHSHAGAARVLGIHPNNLHRLMRNLDLKPS
jgi:transcriptional regulator with GAF, ATPase, and Fis domain